MSLATLMSQTGTIVHPATATDRYENEVTDWDTATSTSTKCWLTEVSGSEVRDGRDAMVTGWLLYLPPGTTIEGIDRFVLDGVTYEVDGPPRSAGVPAVGEHHIEASLKRVDG